MKLIVCILLCVAFVLAQQGTSQPPCPLNNAPCAFVDETSCPCGVDRSECCPTCCTDCANCFANPCDGYACSGFPGYTCEANYCGGCNRDWFDSNGNFVTCELETKESACALVDCIPPELLDCPNSCGIAPRGDSCCEQCCTECAECFVAPCDGYSCKGHSEYTCGDNYCGGCNRDWFDASGRKVTCEEEVFGSGNNDDVDSSEWNVDCKHDEDCSLMNTDRGFDCCSTGGCDLTDYSDSVWQPVNSVWWYNKHDSCVAVSQCLPQPPLACPELYVIPAYEAVCHKKQCTKVKAEQPDYPHNDDSDSSKSNAALLAVGAMMLVPIVAL